MIKYANGDQAPSWTVQTPTVYNVTMTNADTEYSQALPAGCKRFSLSIRGGVSTDVLRFAYVTGKVATPTAPYMQMTGDAEKYEMDLSLDAQTLYFACAGAGKVAQIEAWV